MFKTTFSKHILTFVIIIFFSFLILTGIISSLIYSEATERKETELIAASDSIAKHISDSDVEELDKYIPFFNMSISLLINKDKSLDILIVNATGEILLSTLNSQVDETTGERVPSFNRDLGTIDMNIFEKTDNNQFSIHHGTLGNLVEYKSIAYAKEFVTKESVRGYVVSISSTEAIYSLISDTRSTITYSFIWVMLATIIIIYFITERMTHPLKSMTSAAKKFAKGDFTGRVAVYGNDEVAELGNAFNNMAESLQNLETMRKSFLASVSHDLRTPMTTISGFIDGINSGAIPPEKHEYYLGVISTEVHRLSRLVSMLLDISRIESGDRKFTSSDFDVSEVARLVLISFEQKIDEKRLDVEFVCPDEKVIVFADKDAIHQVIYNLCHNAIKFADAGGKLMIKIERSENQKISISVFDEGQIISAEDSDMIFKQFYKTDKSRGLDKSGVGLGLYICKTIIDAHCETISVKSVEGYGTEFIFTLQEGNK